MKRNPLTLITVKQINITLRTCWSWCGGLPSLAFVFSDLGNMRARYWESKQVSKWMHLHFHPCLFIPMSALIVFGHVIRRPNFRSEIFILYFWGFLFQSLIMARGVLQWKVTRETIYVMSLLMANLNIGKPICVDGALNGEQRAPGK